MDLPLADLHRHLDGSLRPATLQELAREQGVALPERLAFWPGMGLAEALACFRVTLALLQTPDAVRRVAGEICQDASREGVATLEIRFAPQLHKGAPPGAIVDAALEGIASRAGLVLCGLYGEPPSVLTELVELGRARPGVVGIDLAGGPAPDQQWRMEDYAGPFRAARDAGLGRTVHAGEGRPPAEIRLAVELLGACRIGHGTTVLEDPAVADLLIERSICIEANVTSNYHVGAIPSIEAHPLPAWLDRGLVACICTDNTLLSGVDAPEEHRRVLSIPGMDEGRLERCVQSGHASAFRRA
ncbi:MAG: adenosine deaminase family protein [Polyangia bacterium]|jgi:adenosine deaminase|nr:adenosine deaminase family protein [Polyangia bacterium]